MQDYPNLFSGFEIGSVRLRNRIVFQPHFTALGSLDGMPSDDHVAYHEARARGGVGLIVFESQAIHPSGKMSRRFVNAWDSAVIPAYLRLTEAVHRHGARIFGQLTHGGHTSLEHPPHLLWAPSQMPEPSSHFSTKAMDPEDIAATIEGFASSARNAVEGGFDGVEVKIAHDGLLRSFASPYFNHRTDGYGGGFEKRMRLSIEVLEAIRAAVPAGFPIGARLCLDEFTTFGYGLEYGLRMATYLESSGCVDYFNADAGSFSSYWMEIPPAAVSAGSFRHLNAALKAQTRLPVVAFGRIAPPELAESMLRAGEADLIGLARQLIADPDTPEKLRRGDAHRVRPCIACNDACIFQVGQEKAIRCVHNPAAGREREVDAMTSRPRTDHRRIVVVGGGPAGLKVAEVAALRGHSVVLFEQEPVLGGQINLAARQPEHDSIGGVISHLEAVVRDLGVDLRLGTRIDAARIDSEAPDRIVIATGSEPNLPSRAGQPDETLRARELGRQVPLAVPGLDLPFVYSSDQVLSGAANLSGRVLVIDGNGHWEGAGTAEYLADQGCEVTIATADPLVGGDIEGGTRTLFQRRAAIKGIIVRTGLALRAVETDRVVFAPVFSANGSGGFGRYLLVGGDDVVIAGFDAVVAILGRRSRESLWHACRDLASLRSVPMIRTGDAVAPRLLESTIAEAHRLAFDL